MCLVDMTLVSQLNMVDILQVTYFTRALFMVNIIYIYNHPEVDRISHVQ